MTRDQAETQGKRLGQVPAGLTRLLVSLATLCALWLLPSTAQAGSGVGMCADTAQSIEAPPPLYPGDGATLADCEHFDVRSGIASAPLTNPHSRIWVEAPLHHDLGVVPSLLSVAPSSSKLAGRPANDAAWLDSHPQGLLRPPCA